MIVHIFNSCIVSGPETLAMPALRQLGEEVVVVCLFETRRAAEAEGPVAYARSLGLRTECVNVRRRIDWGAVRDLAALLTELSPQIVHAHDVKASTYLLYAARRLPPHSFKLVSTHHGVRARSGWRNIWYERFYVRFVLPRFDCALVVCSSDRDLLLKRGLQPGLVRVHLNGIDREEVVPEARDQRRAEIQRAWGLAELGIADDAVVLGFAGRLALEKRVDRLLGVARYMEELTVRSEPPLPPWHILMFGSGPLEQQLKQVARDFKLEHRVHWMGYRDGLGNEMAGFDVLLSLSDAEGLPINLLEAGWAGTPVLATAVDGNHDLFSGELADALVAVDMPEQEMAERLAGLVADVEQRSKLGQLFQRRVRTDFSGAQWVAELQRIYEDLG